MASSGVTTATPLTRLLGAIAALAAVASCDTWMAEEIPPGPYAPGVDLSKPAVDGVDVGNRLMEAGEYELALKAFNRAALENGMTSEVLIGLGSANLGLGRLGQAEKLLRRAVDEYPAVPEAWNNLGVVLMEKGEIPEAQLIFERAFALDNGESNSIRENLSLALAKSEKAANNVEQKEEYKLVQQDGGAYLIRQTP